MVYVRSSWNCCWIFFPVVDEYASLSLDTLEPAVAAVEGTEPANWPYAYMWVGVEDKRTIGQTRGRVVNAGAEDEACVPCTPTGTEEGECALPAGVGNGTEAPCYGWRLHNKPVMAGGHWLLTGVTVIVHLDRGVVAKHGKLGLTGSCFGKDVILSNDNLRDVGDAIALTFVQTISLTQRDIFELLPDYPKAFYTVRPPLIS